MDDQWYSGYEWRDEYKMYYDPATGNWFTKTGSRVPDPTKDTPVPPDNPYTGQPREPVPDQKSPSGNPVWKAPYSRPPPQTSYLPAGTPVGGGIAPARVDMPDPAGYSNQPWSQYSPRNGNNTPLGAVSGALRNFAPHGQVLSQFSAPRTYGGKPRGT